jgi:hypothetical protein
MALTKITKSGLTADVVDETKIADNAISDEHLDITSITGHTELSETAANTDILLIYDSSAGTLKKITASNVGLQAPTISSVSPTSVTSGDGTGNYTFTITGTEFTGASTNLINNSGTSVNFDTVTVDSDTQITAVIAKSSLPNSGEPYDVRVSASSGLNTILENQINIDASPTFNTSSGSLGTVLNALVGSTTLTVEAFDPESAGNVTYEIQSGSLPAGATATTVHENGVSKYQISGFSAVGSNTTSNFVLRAVDAASNTSSRAFSITVNAPVSESFTTSGTFSVPSGITSVDVMVIGGGGGGGYAENGSHTGGGGGAGGLVFMPGYPVTPGGTVSVTVGCGGAGGPGNPGPYPNTVSNGQDSVFGTLTAKGGGGGGAHGANSGGPQAAGQGGSGGGGNSISSCGNTPGGSGIQPTQPGNSGAYGFGNPGGAAGLYASTPNRTGSAGGGGAGHAGGGGGIQPGNPAPGGGQNAGNGGLGKSYTIADGTTPVYYAGGGGGAGGYSAEATPFSPTQRDWSLGGNALPVNTGTGGLGGGGNGANYVCGPVGCRASSGGQANKGGGGGGGTNSCDGAGFDGKTGGKGIVIVRY